MSVAEHFLAAAGGAPALLLAGQGVPPEQGRAELMLARPDNAVELFRIISTDPASSPALAEMAGLGPAVYRRPLCEMAPANRDKLRATLQACGVVK